MLELLIHLTDLDSGRPNLVVKLPLNTAQDSLDLGSIGLALAAMRCTSPLWVQLTVLGQVYSVVYFACTFETGVHYCVFFGLNNWLIEETEITNLFDTICLTFNCTRVGIPRYTKMGRVFT